MQDVVSVDHIGIDADTGIPVQAVLQIECQLIVPRLVRQLDFGAQLVTELLAVLIIAGVAVVPGFRFAAFEGPRAAVRNGEGLLGE